MTIVVQKGYNRVFPAFGPKELDESLKHNFFGGEHFIILRVYFNFFLNWFLLHVILISYLVLTHGLLYLDAQGLPPGHIHNRCIAKTLLINDDLWRSYVVYALGHPNDPTSLGVQLHICYAYFFEVVLGVFLRKVPGIVV
jgi:hypothetical protein